MNTTAKSEVGDGDDGAGGEEFAHRIEIADLVGDDADRGRPLRQLHREYMLEDVRGHDDVELLARHVDDAAAHHADDEIEDHRDPHADRQRDQRGHGAVRHHAVVDVHDEEGAREREHVHNQCGDRDVAVVRPEAAHDRPEPVRAGQVAGGDCARIGARCRADQKRETQILGVEFAHRARLRSCTAARIDHSRHFRVEVDREQNARRAVAHREHGGQDQRWDLGELAPYGLAFEASLGGGALEERRRQAAVEDGEAGHQGFAADRAAMMRCEEKQRIGQRIPGVLGRRGRRVRLGGTTRLCVNNQSRESCLATSDKGIIFRGLCHLCLSQV